jgi:BMFP domain-containing protein YqiC
LKKKFREFSNPSSNQEFESSFKSLVSAALKKLDVVPRAEFEKQKKVLEKAQKKLDELEEIIDKLLKSKKKQ